MSSINDVTKVSLSIIQSANRSSGEDSADEAVVLGLLDTLRTLSSSENGVSLPDLGTLRDLAQKLWNFTVRSLHSAEGDCRIKALIREAATFMYLLSMRFFAHLPHVRIGYMQSHPLEAERCVLMCLKTAKCLCSANLHRPNGVQLLRWASQILEGAAHLKGDGDSHLLLEVHFAELVTNWGAGEYDLAMDAAERLANKARGNMPYREALLQFIFNAANAPAVEPSVEERLRTLLELSLRVQCEQGNRTLEKHRAFCGVTVLQIARSFLRTGLPAEALERAQEASQYVQSLEPLVLQIEAHTALGDFANAFRALGPVSLSDEITLHELFALARRLIQINARCTEDLVTFFTQDGGHSDAMAARFADEASAFTARLSALLLQIGTERAIARLNVELRRNGDTLNVTQARFRFCAFWSVNQNDGLSAALRTQSLLSALTYTEAASDEEVESVVLSLAEHCFSTYRVTGTIQTLVPLQEVFSRLSDRCSSVYSLVYRCQAMSALGSDEAAVGLLSEGITRFPAEEITGAVGAMINFFLLEHKLGAAGTVAHILLVSCEHMVTREEKLGFLKVWALGLLHSCSSDTDVSALVEVANSACAVLSVGDTSNDGAGTEWWCRFLWLASDYMSHKLPVEALSVSQVATDLYMKSHDSDSGSGCSPLLTNRLLKALDTEFCLFSRGTPHLTIEKIEKILELLGDGSENDCGAPVSVVTRIRCLASAERDLRVRASGEQQIHTLDRTSFVASLIASHVTTADLSDLASGAAALALSVHGDNRSLRRLAACIQTACAEGMLNEAAATTGSCLWAMYYRAYELCPCAESRYEVLHRVSEVVGACRTNNNSSNAPSEEHSSESSELYNVTTLLEFFTIEAWNATVHSNAAHQRSEVDKWLSTTLALCESLPKDNLTRITVSRLSEDMPLM